MSDTALERYYTGRSADSCGECGAAHGDEHEEDCPRRLCDCGQPPAFCRCDPVED